MKRLILFSLVTIGVFFFSGCMAQDKKSDKLAFTVNKTDKQWKKDLSKKEYLVLRQAATEKPFTGKYYMFFKNGIYRCAACGAKLFKSDSKFKSSCGWPSFDRALKGAVIKRPDYSLGMTRTEILCANCGSHLGHVFKDGPTQTGLRYCINSVSLNFKDKAKTE